MQLRKLTRRAPAYLPLTQFARVVTSCGTIAESQSWVATSVPFAVHAHGHLCGSQRPSAVRRTAPRPRALPSSPVAPKRGVACGSDVLPFSSEEF